MKSFSQTLLNFTCLYSGTLITLLYTTGIICDQKTSKVKVLVCGWKLNPASYACVHQYLTIQWKPLFTLFWVSMKNSVNCRKHKNYKVNQKLECSTNNVHKLLCKVWTFLQHITLKNKKNTQNHSGSYSDLSNTRPINVFAQNKWWIYLNK